MLATLDSVIYQRHLPLLAAALTQPLLLPGPAAAAWVTAAFVNAIFAEKLIENVVVMDCLSFRSDTARKRGACCERWKRREVVRRHGWRV